MMQRRKFIKDSALIGAAGFAVGPQAIQASVSGKRGVAENLKFAVIGCNGMGWSNTRSLLNIEGIELTAIVDIDQNVIDNRLEEYKTLRDNKVKTYTDYRKMLKDKDIDFVVVGTPDHWHCKIMVDAVMAGKHVYEEKPVANSIEECNLMLAATKRTGKVVQVGQWQRSGTHYTQAKEIVDSGELGKIRQVKTWRYKGWTQDIPAKPDGPVPEGVDYDFWLGPAPKKPFNPNRFHYNWRWFWDYGGGVMTDWGVHELDIAFHFMGVTSPNSVMASGGKFAYPDDANETPDTLTVVYEFDNFNITWEHALGIDNGPYGRGEGIAFIGSNGTLVVNRDGMEVIIERDQGRRLMEPREIVRPPAGANYLDFHTQNFVEAIRKNDPSILKTPMESGVTAAINAQMGMIAYRTKSKVFWDTQTGTFIDNDEANAMIKPDYQNGWELPTV